MSPDPLDPETLAALLDGTLTNEDRDRALAVLAVGGQAYRDFLEAAAIHGELTGESAPQVAVAAPAVSRSHPSGTPGRLARLWPPHRRFLLVSAFAAAGIVVVMLVRSGRNDSAVALSRNALSRQYAAASTVDKAAQGRGAAELPAWSGNRGANDDLESTARAFRMGVRSADLDLAIVRRDSATMVRVTNDLAMLVSGAIAGAPVAARYKRLGDMPIDRARAERDVVIAELRSASGAPDWLDLGMLLEATRLIVRSGGSDAWQADGATWGLLHRALAIVERLPSGERASADASLTELRRLDQARLKFPGGALAASAALDSAVVALGR